MKSFANIKIHFLKNKLYENIQYGRKYINPLEQIEKVKGFLVKGQKTDFGLSITCLIWRAESKTNIL